MLADQVLLQARNVQERVAAQVESAQGREEREEAVGEPPGDRQVAEVEAVQAHARPAARRCRGEGAEGRGEGRRQLEAGEVVV